MKSYRTSQHSLQDDAHGVELLPVPDGLLAPAQMPAAVTLSTPYHLWENGKLVRFAPKLKAHAAPGLGIPFPGRG